MGVYYDHCLFPRDNTVRPGPERIAALINAWLENGFVVRREDRRSLDPAGSNRGKSDTGARVRTSSLLEEYPQKPAIHMLRPNLWTRLFGATGKDTRSDPWMPFCVPPTEASLLALAQPHAVIELEGNSSALYPMQTVRGDRYEDPHALVLEVCDDFVHPQVESAKQISPICSCGFNLEYESSFGWLTTDRIHRICPACGTAFRPQDQTAEIVNGVTGARSLQPGGLCNRFAIIVSFGKVIPSYMPSSEGGELVAVEPKATHHFMDICHNALGTELNEFSYYS